VALGDLAKTALAGGLPRELAPIWCTSALIPLAKKDGGVRPIAVGDTLRRLVGKVALRTATLREETANLRPRQCGVGVPMAADLVGMTAQSLANGTDDADWVILQVDVRNAFNSIYRSSILEGCLRRAPSAYNWLSWCYGQPCPLYSQGLEVAQSTLGVHQGDAMGPLGFALGLERALDQCTSAESRLTWYSWYLDDGTLVGSVQDVADYLAQLAPALSAVGLTINLDKCSLWGPGLKCPVGSRPTFPDSVGLGHPITAVPVIDYHPGSGITVLGTPIHHPGGMDYADSKWENVTQNASETPPSAPGRSITTHAAETLSGRVKGESPLAHH